MNENLPPVQQAPPQSPEQPATSSSSSDAQENKAISAIGYLGILCFVPLLLKKDSAFAQYHGKQGLVLFIAWVAVNLLWLIPLFGWLLIPVGHFVAFILMVVGIVNAVNGDMKELPWIGQFAKHINL